MSDDLDLTPEEKRQILAQRISQAKANRYSQIVTLDLVKAIPEADPGRALAVEQAERDVVVAEGVVRQLQEMDDEIVKAIENGDAPRAVRRRVAREKGKTDGK